MMTYLSPAADTRGRILQEKGPVSTPVVAMEETSDVFGNTCLRLVAPKGAFSLVYDALVRDEAPAMPRAHGAAVSVEALPMGCMPFVTASRYCETDRFGTLAWKLFGDVPAGRARVEAICDYVRERLVFSYGYSTGLRTAMEAHVDRVGVCRDYAHLAVTLCRAMNMPARYVNGFVADTAADPQPAPMDFHAWFEVYLASGWHTFDAFRPDIATGRIAVARGRDAADIPLIQTFGSHELTTFKIWTRRESEGRLGRPHEDADVSLVSPWFSTRWARHLHERERGR
ncbi:transglutaminase family protein [Ciceribacter sp. sgz301302]